MRGRAFLVDAVVLAGVAVASSLFGVSFVSGGSMRPALAPGDLVVYERRVAAPRTGDIVVLGTRGHRYVHRVVGMAGDGRLVTAGDANPIPDREPTTSAAVRGRVVAVAPSGALFERLASSAGNARLWSQSQTER